MDILLSSLFKIITERIDALRVAGWVRPEVCDAFATSSVGSEVAITTVLNSVRFRNILWSATP